VSVTSELFQETLSQVVQGLLAQGFRGVFVVNGHGANLEPARAVAATLPEGAVHIQSWWDPELVATLRRDLFGDWEGMHATPSEIAVTQVFYGCKPEGAAADPPEKLSEEFIAAHSGDRHGPPDAHRAQFPDGRVGSHSALATPEFGKELLKTAAEALARDFERFSAS
jgi:creatinine amidohydrolase